MNLWLTGFMGAGNTTTARRLARILSLPFTDTDTEIEREHGPIADIFEAAGEGEFRLLESAAIARLAAASATIVAVGVAPSYRPAIAQRCIRAARSSIFPSR